MLGKEIAENLRNSKEGWCRGSFVVLRGEAPRYCVLGLKAREAGIPDEFLDFNTRAFSEEEGRIWDQLADSPLYREVYKLNDACFSKGEVIEVFDSPEHRDHDFKGVELVIEYFKAYMQRSQCDGQLSD